MAIAPALLKDTEQFVNDLKQLAFGPPVAYVYNPLSYALEAWRQYVLKYADGPKRVVFLGMNPGPFGMAQTGVPFGDVAIVRDWLGIEAAIQKPEKEHPKRPVLGFDCPRSEVSGSRLWEWLQLRFGHPDRFFQNHFIANYCPLVFLEASGRNRTPDKLPKAERQPLLAICDRHLQFLLDCLQPEHAIGIGNFAAERLHHVGGRSAMKVGKILHPSPANPTANKDWAGTVERQLSAMSVKGF